jgi:solute carrier family 25 (mitochondrial carnitine/acylcarnitine transporter), member 20/29
MISASTKGPQNYDPSARYIGDKMDKKLNSVQLSLIAGSVSGIAATTIVYPCDVLRTKMQSQAQTSISHALGPKQVLLQTLRQGGISALYTGISLPLAAQAVYKATIFSVNEICQSIILENKFKSRQTMGSTDSNHNLSMSERLACGFTSGAINAALFVTPVEYVRNQLIGQHTKLASHQIPQDQALGTLGVIRSTIKSHGLMGLWRGVGMTVMRDSLGCSFFFASLAYSKQILSPQGDEFNLSVTIVAGACAGIGFWIVALPLDTIKTWIQEGQSARHVLLDSLRQHGWKQTVKKLCRGWQMAFGRGAPSAAITLCTYDIVHNELKKIRQH